MAIGSEGEIGQNFGVWGEMTPEEQQAWWEHMRTKWGDNIMAGYSEVVYPNREVE